MLPDGINLNSNTMSWERATATLERLPPEAQQDFVDRFGAAALNHANPVVRTAVQNSLARGPGTALLRMAMLGAAVAGSIRVFVRSRHDSRAYEIAGHVWREPAELIVNPVVLAVTGRFVVSRELLLHGSLDVSLAGEDLFIGEAELNDVIKAGAGSEAARNRAARGLIEAFLLEHPDERQKIKALVSALRQRFPGASEASLKRAIRGAMPTEWKKGGRPSGLSGPKLTITKPRRDSRT